MAISEYILTSASKLGLVQDLRCTPNLTFTQKLSYHTKLDVSPELNVHTKPDFYSKFLKLPNKSVMSTENLTSN